MTIFIPEYIIYWSNCSNLFLVEYSPIYVFVVDNLFFDFDNYSALYKTGAFNKSGYVKYPRWMIRNFYRNYGIEVLRARMYEKFFFWKWFGVKKMFFHEGRFYKFVHYYYLHDLLFRCNDTFTLLDFVKNRDYYVEKGNWITTFLHPRKWRWGIAKMHRLGIEQILREETIWTLHFDTWDKLCLYALGGVSKQYWVNLVNFFLYNFYNKDWFDEIYIYDFFNNYKFLKMYRLIVWPIFEIYIYFDFIFLIPIKCYLFYLFYHFIYDISFLLFFYNKFIIKMVLEIYYLIIGFYTTIIFWISSLRMFKQTVMGKNYDLENLLKVKQLALRNYCYKLFLNKGISKQNEEYVRKIDDNVNYPFILIYLFKYKFEFFIFLERFVINLSYFFNKYFFIDLLKKYYLRNAISFFNFLIIIFIFFPIYMFCYFIYYFFYATFFIKFFFKDSFYWYFGINKFSKIYEDIYRNLLLEKIYEEKYDYLIYWFNILKFEHFTLTYYKNDRESVYKKYKEILDKPRSNRDAPIEDVLFEYWSERSKYGIGLGSGGFKAYNNYFIFNKIAGNYIKTKMHLNDHYYEDPFFFSVCLDHLKLKWFRNIITITLILNFIQIEYFKNILNHLKLIFSGFWYYYFYIICFYPVYFLFYFLELFHFIYLSLSFYSYYNIICKFYLHMIIIKKCLLSFQLIKIIISILKFIYNYWMYFWIKFRLYIENDKRTKLLSFETWKFCILFYFYFLRYKFILKIFRIFFIRLWIIAFSLVILVFFFDNEELWGFCYYFMGVVKFNDYTWDAINTIFDPNYSFIFLLKSHLLLNLHYSFNEFNRYFFNWSIIHMDWVMYVKAWYKIYNPSVHFLLMPFKQLLMWLHLDYKWWIFQIKLWFNMDYVLLH